MATSTSMEFKTNFITPDIKLSIFEDEFFKTEVLFEHHLLVWFIVGETKIIQAGDKLLVGGREYRVFNTLRLAHAVDLTLTKWLIRSNFN